MEDTIYACDFGIKLKLSREDALISGVAQMGCINPHETRILLRCLRSGDTVVEIGTYKDGWLALVASQIVGQLGKVICFEPIPQYCEEFKENVILNNRHNIIVEQLAISDHTGKVTFNVATSNSSFIINHASVKEQITVQTTTLDDYLRSKGISSVDLLIVDAEGAEPLILQGAQNILKHSVKYFMLEVIDDFLARTGSSSNQIVRSLTALGYQAYIITRKGLRKYGPSERSETLNMFFVKGRNRSCSVGF